MNIKTKTIQLAPGVALEMLHIPGGTFMMGSSEDEVDRYNDEGPQHEVRVASFFMGRYPITQAQWRVVASLPEVEQELDPNPSDFKGDNRPVEQVSWFDVMEFCARLSAHTGQIYTLPSEAQWEYACRAGTTSPFYFGRTLTTDLANYDGNQTTEVGNFPPNAFGLYDMHGNVWEWCLDHFHNSYKRAPTDGSAWVNAEAGEYKSRIVRGGSWHFNPRFCRCAFRLYNFPDYRNNNFGFRVVSVPPRALK